MREFKAGDRVVVTSAVGIEKLWYGVGWTGTILCRTPHIDTYVVEFDSQFKAKDVVGTNSDLGWSDQGGCRWYVSGVSIKRHAGPIDYTSVDEGGVV